MKWNENGGENMGMIDFEKFKNGKYVVNNEFYIYTLSGFFNHYFNENGDIFPDYNDKKLHFGEFCKIHNFTNNDCLVLIYNFSGDECVIIFNTGNGTFYNCGCMFDEFCIMKNLCRELECLLWVVCNPVMNW